MKAHFKTPGGRLTFEVEGETIKDLFQEIANLQEVFEADTTCGCCNSTNIKYNFRVADSFSFYELKCQEEKCGAAFSFGQNKNGVDLFPKRTSDGAALPNRGWKVYRAGQGASTHWEP